MEELLIQNARTYAAQHQLGLAERLGFGIHGIVFVAENNTKAGKTAVKVHRAAEPFRRECAVYERLRGAGVSKILGFNVPQLIRIDDKLLVVEMTVVVRPFVLDFAGAYLDALPNFPEETWAEWEAENENSSIFAGQEYRPFWRNWNRWTSTWWMCRQAMSHSSTDEDRSRLTVHRLLDMLMQNAWSWTAFVDSASRHGQFRAASSPAGFMFVSNPVP